MQAKPDQSKKQFARRVFLLCLAITAFGMYVGSEAKAGHNIIGANSDLSGVLFFTYGSIGMLFSLEDQFINALYKNRWLQMFCSFWYSESASYNFSRSNLLSLIKIFLCSAGKVRQFFWVIPVFSFMCSSEL
jgi:hypothetical protein